VQNTADISFHTMGKVLLLSYTLNVAIFMDIAMWRPCVNRRFGRTSIPPKRQVKDILKPTNSRQFYLGVRHLSGTRDQFFFIFWKWFLSSYRFVHMEGPLWREVGSVVLSCCWASQVQSLSDCLNFENPPPIWWATSCIYFQEQGSPIIPPCIGPVWRMPGRPY
jgi:hypothetical protein